MKPKYIIGKEILLFVYGSMKKGFRNNHRLKDSIYLGKAETVSRYCMYPSLTYMFPYVLESKKQFEIKGELYKIDGVTLDVIEQFEGEGFAYIRKEIDIQVNEKLHRAYIYFIHPDNRNGFDKDIQLKDWLIEFEAAGIKLDEHIQLLIKAFDKSRVHL